METQLETTSLVNQVRSQEEAGVEILETQLGTTSLDYQVRSHLLFPENDLFHDLPALYSILMGSWNTYALMQTI